MSISKEVASQILDSIGGKNNIKNVYHCTERLRNNLVELARVDIEAWRLQNGRS